MTPEEIYDQVIKPLPAIDRLWLVEKIIHDVSKPPAKEAPLERYSWMAVRGCTPNLLGGMDAQEWVSASRRRE